MKLISCSIDWMVGYTASPKLKIVVDAIPHRDALVYRRSKVDPTLWVAEQEGYVSFYSWSGCGNDGGFYGREFAINTPEGKVTLRGPFSGRAGLVNNTEFTECVDVGLYYTPGDTLGYAAAVTLDFARQAVRTLGIDLLKCDDGERTWVPDPRQGPVQRCLRCFSPIERCRAAAVVNPTHHEPVEDIL